MLNIYKGIADALHTDVNFACVYITMKSKNLNFNSKDPNYHLESNAIIFTVGRGTEVIA